MKLFSEVVSADFSGKRLEGKPNGFFKGIPSVVFTRDDISELSSRFKLALVAKFLTRPSFTSMTKFLQKLGLKGSYELSVLPHQRFLINFREEEDYLRLFLRGTWQVFGYTMTLTKWSPSLSQETESPVMHIWIAFPDLPIHLHDKRALHLISSSIGTPLKVDSSTLNFSRPGLARCCVEVDISNLPPAKVLINHGGEELIFSFYYENFPLYCKSCKRTGHLQDTCHRKQADRKKEATSEKVAKDSKDQLLGEKNEGKWQQAVIEEEQILSCCFKHLESSSSLWISNVYGKHNRVDRISLWNSLRGLYPIQCPWIIGGDFNTVASITEHKGVICPDIRSMDDLNKAISDCELISPPFLGSQFTWFGKRGRGRVCRRLDRVLINEACMDLFPNIEIKHLGRGNSDHRPIQIKLLHSSASGPRPFKFLNFWTSHNTYKNMFSSSWDMHYEGGGMRGLAKKLSNFKRSLHVWNKKTFGNLFLEVSNAEKRAEKAEENLENDDSETNLLEFKLATALLQQTLKKEESFWAQKANLKWISQGDASTAFFHSFVRGRRHRLFISSLKDGNGKIFNTTEGISNLVVEHFTSVFSTNHEGEMGEILAHIPTCVSHQDNSLIMAIPEEEEIKKTIWFLNANSTAGPDGFNGFFFRDSWDTIKTDVCKAVQEFFLGIPLPKAFGSTLLTLIPKKEGSITLDQFRPISLSTFFSKIISRILSERLKKIIPKLISQEQAAFQVGKNITDQILMVKEMVHLLSANTRGGNCIIKLDLSKAFDKLSWTYLEGVLTKFGFIQHAIHLLMGNLKATHFSVLVNGQPKGFFPMKCGVKQGDPLSPLLFIIALEGLSRFLNYHHSSGLIKPFSAGRTPTPCHLLYADDIILFTTANSRNLLRLRELLSTFLRASGQEINYSKSQVIVHGKMKIEKQNMIRRILSIRCNTKEFTYLGSTIVKGKLRKVHCKDLIEKFEKRLNAWYSKKLNQMGRLILIKHVLSLIPLHLMAAQRIPKSILKSLNRLMANYF
ncbi:unnamed protein product [Cuscuta campestris]|uniref:Reverse transcriptase domain-containing protein n=1 Tax=Cuscuta campestris TaxID=132261 RepID=A0A484NPM2_9ASTE|nr:unnamed protein product [Cuscuta campestris]